MSHRCSTFSADFLLSGILAVKSKLCKWCNYVTKWNSKWKSLNSLQCFPVLAISAENRREINIDTVTCSVYLLTDWLDAYRVSVDTELCLVGRGDDYCLSRLRADGTFKCYRKKFLRDCCQTCMRWMGYHNISTYNLHQLLYFHRLMIT